MGGRKERKRRKERKKKEKERGRRRREEEGNRTSIVQWSEPDQHRAVVGPGQARNGTALQEVGVFLPRFYSTPRGFVMAYGFRPDFERICMMCVIVGWSGTEYMSSWDHKGLARRPRTEKIWTKWKAGACLNF